MKNTVKHVLISIFTVIWFLPLNAHSGEKAGAVSVSPMGGVYFFDNQQDIEKEAIGGLGAAYSFTDNWATEIMMNYGQFKHEYFTYEKCCCERDRADGYIMHLDALYHFRPDKKLVPYIAAGAGGVVLDGDHLKEEYATVNYGGGLKYYVTDNIALRGDARHVYDLEDSRNNASVSVGLTFQFGGGKKVAEPKPAPAPAAKAEPEPEQDKVVGIDEFQPGPVKEKVSIDMKLQFDLDKSDIRPEYHSHIKKLADFMKSYPQTCADIEGHTCNIGTARYNFNLSWRRAESVKSYLVKNFGIESSRIRTFGFGLTRPIADNSTEEGRIKNRRVIVVVSNGTSKDSPPKPAWDRTGILQDRKDSRLLRDIQMCMERGQLHVALISDRTIRDFKAFQLREPRRLVVDLPGKWTSRGSKVRTIENDCIGAIRIGQHPDKLRVVFDLKNGQAAAVSVTPVQDGLMVNVDSHSEERVSLK
ncbi:MAG: outer membrane beta-barrel domain-containing protein [Desulfococcaceae bacterium]